MLIRILTKQFVKYIRRDLALQFLLRSFSKGDLDSILPCQLASKRHLEFILAFQLFAKRRFDSILAFKLVF